MTLLYFTGFESWGSDAVIDGWNTVGGTVQTSSNTPWSYGSSIKWTGTAIAYLPINIPSNSTSIIIGFNIYKNDTNIINIGLTSNATFTGGGTNSMAQFNSGSTTGNIISTSGTSTSFSYTGAKWNYIEITTTLSNGNTVVKINGTVAGTSNGSSIFSPTLLFLSSSTTSSQTFIDDLYILANDGISPTAYLGRVRSGLALPSAAGTYSNALPYTNTNHYANVNQVPNDGITTVNNHTTVGSKDTYKISGLPTEQTTTGTTIVAARQRSLAQGVFISANVSNVTITSSENDSSNITNVSGTSFNAVVDLMVNDPATSSSWSPSTFTTMEIGTTLKS